MQDKDSAPRLLIDLNYILNKTMLGGKDPDAIITLVDGKPVSVNSARYGVDGFYLMSLIAAGGLACIAAGRLAAQPQSAVSGG